ncbi:MAG: hypothetical protein WC998_09320 [Candidatus Paceibacterota bacterium]
MEEKIKACMEKLKEKYPQKSICITVNFWHFNNSGNDETKLSLYMETGKNLEFDTVEKLVNGVEFILSLSTPPITTNTTESF